ncbi:unnamed protein product [Oncorhynchus mykiss]|uniref:C-type lectin domain-containing protein n=1 Tax=Oncorhynchus mykiss TaxID=8022 RepID=A0A060YNL2_ONCMY|nr:unnamed protein product [Oncorhynchus mykiss]
MAQAGRSVSTSCPTGWSHYRRHCYILSLGVASWSSAQRACTLLFDSNLTGVQSKKDMAWLWNLLGTGLLDRPVRQPGTLDLDGRQIPVILQTQEGPSPRAAARECCL